MRERETIESEVDSSSLPTGGSDSSSSRTMLVMGEVENVGVMKTNELRD